MNRQVLLIITFICVVFLPGCWSQKELTDLALVSALGIDKNKEGKYVVTFQIVNPNNVAAGKQGSGQTAPVTVYTITGDNLVEASKKAAEKVSRRLYYSHTNLVVISEELAKKEGIMKIFDALERDPEFRTTTPVVIAHQTKAKNILVTLTALDKIPSNKVIKTLEFSEKRWGEFFKVNVQEVIKNLVSPGKEPIISGFEIGGSEKEGKKMTDFQNTTPTRIQASGLAIFKNGKLIDWFHRGEAIGTSFILDKVKATDININWMEENEAIAYEMIRQKTKVSASKEKNKLPVITIDVTAEGDIEELEVPVDISNPDVLVQIEKEVEKKIKKEIETAVHQAQEDKADIFGFGEMVHLKNPKEWKNLKKDWHDIHFPQLEVKVKVDAFVRRTGLRNKSYLSNIGEER